MSRPGRVGREEYVPRAKNKSFLVAGREFQHAGKCNHELIAGSGMPIESRAGSRLFKVRGLSRLNGPERNVETLDV